MFAQLSPKLARLAEILTWKRPHASKTEKEFVDTFFAKYTVSKFGPMENIVIVVPGGNAKVMFSCHTDTVHMDDGRQEISVDAEFGFFSVPDADTPRSAHYSKGRNVLGADDGTGIWLMAEMIDAGIPGTYVFHRGEERGGVGSSWMASHMSEWLSSFDYAIAFDRAGYEDVITHQAGSRCCSDEFAAALVAQLNASGLSYKPSSKGVFTDTANYTEFIKECTNLSVGYEAQHTSMETQDGEFAERLLEALLKVDWASLPATRDVTEVDFDELPIRSFRRPSTSYPSVIDTEDMAVLATYALSLSPVEFDELVSDLVYEDPENAIAFVTELANRIDLLTQANSIIQDEERKLYAAHH